MTEVQYGNQPEGKNPEVVYAGVPEPEPHDVDDVDDGQVADGASSDAPAADDDDAGQAVDDEE